MVEVAVFIYKKYLHYCELCRIWETLFLVILNPARKPEHVVTLWRTSHPIPSPEAVDALKRLGFIQRHGGVWYCVKLVSPVLGFHEYGFKAGVMAAQHLLGKRVEIIGNVKIREAGGTISDFIGTEKGYDLKVTIRVLSPNSIGRLPNMQILA
ncbi:hypothetical protein R1sor_009906 [Riccia sorocarpa]|uniref:Uncharacterized protein n=1 Tax=Riccia sorocarpa TaxID=122646 RepID=A0ABD3I006_9MARC